MEATREHPEPRSAPLAGGDGLRARASALVGRHGRTSLIVLAVIVLIGFGIRMERVVNPLAEPGDDALAYRALAESLYEEQSYGGEEFTNPTDWSPGAPLIYAGAYYLTGGVRDGVARGVQAIFGTAAIVLVYLLTLRLTRRRAAPLIAAGMAAVYPPFIHSTGALMSEPPAIFMLPASVLAFFWADERESPWAWLLPGALLGLTALIRPEYMFVGILFGLIALARTWIRRGPAPALLSTVALGLAFLVPIVPWTVRNYEDLGRFVPITTGSGKALFVGTYLPGDGEYNRVKAALLEEQRGIELPYDSEALEEVKPEPLFDEVAEKYPDLDRDEALGKIGRENMNHYLGEQPLDYAAMTARKVWRMWSSGIGEAMSSPLGRVAQVAIVLLGLAGLVGLLLWRRLWTALVIGMPIVVITVIGAGTLAPPRRNEILMTLVFPLAAAAMVAGWSRLRRTAWPREAAA